MEISARYHDGKVAAVIAVVVRFEGARMRIIDAASGVVLDDWPADAVFPLAGRSGELRVGCNGRPYGARVAFEGAERVASARNALPGLVHHHVAARTQQGRLVALSTAALIGVIVVYLFGVPLLAARMTYLIPADWERSFGDQVAVQLEAQLMRDGGFEICDRDPESSANRAIARFANKALEGTGSPFEPDVKVIRSTVPNAFALPGGKSFYFSALLNRTETPDEFASVLAHELGHVVHRHALEQLIASAGTGLLIGFILGDMTGISVAGGLGAALIDSRFSREAERQADRFAANVATRMAFKPAGLAALLERVAGDDEFTRALAFLSTHPLTSERRVALDLLAQTSTAGLAPAFTDAEWLAIKSMCDPAQPAGTRGPPPSGDAAGKSFDKKSGGG